MPAFLNVTDIAGLVKGAHEGQGLGNAFLSHIRACDAIFQVLSKSSIALDLSCCSAVLTSLLLYHMTHTLGTNTAVSLTFAGAFDDEEVIHVEGDVNPVRDLEIIHDELRLKDVDYIEKNLTGLEKLVVRGNDKSKKPEYVCMKLIFKFNLKRHM